MQPTNQANKAAKADQATQPKQTEQWHTLTAPQGRKLHIHNPGDYTPSELEWIAQRFNQATSSSTNNDSLSPQSTARTDSASTTTTTAPKDPRTKILDSMTLMAVRQLERDPQAAVPGFVRRELERLEAEWERDGQEGFWRGTGMDKLLEEEKRG